MNDLVYVMFNMKLWKKETRNEKSLSFDDIDFDHEFLTTKEGDVNHESVEQPINVEVVADSRNPPPLDNLVFGSRVEEPVSSGEEFDADEDKWWRWCNRRIGHLKKLVVFWILLTF